MVFGTETYSVLIVSNQHRFNEALIPMLPPSEYYPVCISTNIASARRELLSRNYDFVIINAPLPDDPGTRFAIDAGNRSDTVVLLLLRAENFEEVNERVISHGVFTLQVPFSSGTIRQGLKWMISARERLRKMATNNLSVEEKMEEIRLVNRAKWILIEQLKMNEADAHRHIEKQAMNRCTSKKEIALGIIKTYT